MKKLFIASLLFTSFSSRALDTVGKAALTVVGAAWIGSYVYEFLIKDPKVRQQEQEEKARIVAKAMLAVGTQSLRSHITKDNTDRL